MNQYNKPMKNLSIMLCAVVLLGTACARAQGNASDKNEATAMSYTGIADTSKVYMIKEINADNLVKIYKSLGREANGKVAVKISTGEPGGHNFLDPNLIKPLVQMVNGTIVECNTAYRGKRFSTEDHRKAAENHGFTAIAPVDIMDAEGEVRIPVEGGDHLTYDIVGKSYPEYDFTIILSHFKGHAMGGFGGAIKNMSIGIASSAGKSWIHSGAKTANPDSLWQNLPKQDIFLECMAEAAKGIQSARPGMKTEYRRSRSCHRARCSQSRPHRLSGPQIPYCFAQGPPASPGRSRGRGTRTWKYPAP